MQVILLRWEVMGMPFACWNEAAADVWREMGIITPMCHGRLPAE